MSRSTDAVTFYWIVRDLLSGMQTHRLAFECTRPIYELWASSVILTSMPYAGVEHAEVEAAAALVS